MEQARTGVLGRSEVAICSSLLNRALSLCVCVCVCVCVCACILTMLVSQRERANLVVRIAQYCYPCVRALVCVCVCVCMCVCAHV